MVKNTETIAKKTVKEVGKRKTTTKKKIMKGGDPDDTYTIEPNHTNTGFSHVYHSNYHEHCGSELVEKLTAKKEAAKLAAEKDAKDALAALAAEKAAAEKDAKDAKDALAAEKAAAEKDEKDAKDALAALAAKLTKVQDELAAEKEKTAQAAAAQAAAEETIINEGDGLSKNANNVTTRILTGAVTQAEKEAAEKATAQAAELTAAKAAEKAAREAAREAAKKPIQIFEQIKDILKSFIEKLTIKPVNTHSLNNNDINPQFQKNVNKLLESIKTFNYENYDSSIKLIRTLLYNKDKDKDKDMDILKLFISLKNIHKVSLAEKDTVLAAEKAAREAAENDCKKKLTDLQTAIETLSTFSEKLSTFSDKNKRDIDAISDNVGINGLKPSQFNDDKYGTSKDYLKKILKILHYLYACCNQYNTGQQKLEEINKNYLRLKTQLQENNEKLTSLSSVIEKLSKIPGDIIDNINYNETNKDLSNENLQKYDNYIFLINIRNKLNAYLECSQKIQELRKNNEEKIKLLEEQLEKHIYERNNIITIMNLFINKFSLSDEYRDPDKKHNCIKVTIKEDKLAKLNPITDVSDESELQRVIIKVDEVENEKNYNPGELIHKFKKIFGILLVRIYEISRASNLNYHRFGVDKEGTKENKYRDMGEYKMWDLTEIKATSKINLINIRNTILYEYNLYYDKLKQIADYVYTFHLKDNSNSDCNSYIRNIINNEFKDRVHSEVSIARNGKKKTPPKITDKAFVKILYGLHDKLDGQGNSKNSQISTYLERYYNIAAPGDMWKKAGGGNKKGKNKKKTPKKYTKIKEALKKKSLI